MGCEDCCKNCCYSTPYLTLSAVVFILLGLTGFTIAAVYGTVEMSTVPHLQNGTAVVGPVIGVAVVLTFIPLIFATILAYCITGYIRDVLFHSVVKSCIGSSCNIWVIVLTFLYFLLWLLITVAVGGIMVYYVQAELKCGELEAMGRMNDSSACFPYVDRSFQYFAICGGNGLQELCTDGLKVGLSFSISLLFTLIVVIGLVALMVVQSANFVSALDNMEYRQSNYPRNDAYFMKRVR